MADTSDFLKGLEVRMALLVVVNGAASCGSSRTPLQNQSWDQEGQVLIQRTSWQTEQHGVPRCIPPPVLRIFAQNQIHKPCILFHENALHPLQVSDCVPRDDATEIVGLREQA